MEPEVPPRVTAWSKGDLLTRAVVLQRAKTPVVAGLQVSGLCPAPWGVPGCAEPSSRNGACRPHRSTAIVQVRSKPRKSHEGGTSVACSVVPELDQGASTAKETRCPSIGPERTQPLGEQSWSLASGVPSRGPMAVARRIAASERASRSCWAGNGDSRSPVDVTDGRTARSAGAGGRSVRGSGRRRKPNRGAERGFSTVRSKGSPGSPELLAGWDRSG